MLVSSSRLWTDSERVLTSPRAEHLPFRMSRQMLPWGSTLGWWQGMRHLAMEALYGEPLGNSRESLHLTSFIDFASCSTMVPTRLKRSDSGKAEILLLPVMRVIGCCCSLLPTGPWAGPWMAPHAGCGSFAGHGDTGGSWVAVLGGHPGSVGRETGTRRAQLKLSLSVFLYGLNFLSSVKKILDFFFNRVGAPGRLSQ